METNLVLVQHPVTGLNMWVTQESASRFLQPTVPLAIASVNPDWLKMAIYLMFSESVQAVAALFPVPWMQLFAQLAVEPGTTEQQRWLCTPWNLMIWQFRKVHSDNSLRDILAEVRTQWITCGLPYQLDKFGYLFHQVDWSAFNDLPSDNAVQDYFSRIPAYTLHVSPKPVLITPTSLTP